MIAWGLFIKLSSRFLKQIFPVRNLISCSKATVSGVEWNLFCSLDRHWSAASWNNRKETSYFVLFCWVFKDLKRNVFSFCVTGLDSASPLLLNAAVKWTVMRTVWWSTNNNNTCSNFFFLVFFVLWFFWRRRGMETGGRRVTFQVYL